MNWTHFILLLTGTYLLYYSLNIAADVLRAGKTPARPDAGETFVFDDDTEPQLIAYEEAPQPVPAPEKTAPKPEPVSLPAAAPEYNGALSLKELFRAAQSNLIEFTGAIPY